MSNCPHGGACVDPGNPSECNLNGCIFGNQAEKQEFDNLPDLYQVKAKNGDILKFKNRNQVDFYITDFGGEVV
jgi:hypothetical protein